MADTLFPAYKSVLGEQIAARRAQLEAMQDQPMYSPEEMQRRVSQNSMDEQLGMLAQLSGNAALGNVGGQIFKQALAARQPRVTEKGTADDLRGTFTYNTQYKRDREEERINKLEEREAGFQTAYEGDKRQWERDKEMQRIRHEDAVALKGALGGGGGGGEPLVQAVNPATGEVEYMTRTQALGRKPGKAGGGGEPNEGEKKSAGFAARMLQNEDIFQTIGSKGHATASTQVAGAVPWIGGYARNQAFSPAQRRYFTAARNWIRANLRSESGAVIGEQEEADEYATYFPMPGDDDQTIQDKAALRAIATKAMQTSAGRATIPRLDTRQPEAPRVAPATATGAPAGPIAAAPAAPQAPVSGGRTRVSY